MPVLRKRRLFRLSELAKKRLHSASAEVFFVYDENLIVIERTKHAPLILAKPEPENKFDEQMMRAEIALERLAQNETG